MNITTITAHTETGELLLERNAKEEAIVATVTLALGDARPTERALSIHADEHDIWAFAGDLFALLHGYRGCSGDVSPIVSALRPMLA